MKNRLLSFLALLFFAGIIPSTSRASHAAGGEIIYQHAQDSTYLVIFKFYRDCGGVPWPGHPNNPQLPTLCYFSSCNPTMQSVPLAMWQGQIPPGVPNGTAVTLGCSGSSTECDGNNQIPGVQEWWYYAYVDLGPCNFWTLSTVISARNGSNNINCNDFYIETTFNSQFAPHNSSPYFENKPIPYTCKDLPYSFNNVAIDPEGDSLWTEVINPLTNPGPAGACTNSPSPCNLAVTTPPINMTNNPFQTGSVTPPVTGSFTLNGNSGQITFTATDAGPQTLAIRVKEYRNGVLIGSIIRDVQVQVLDPSLCNYTPSTIDPAVTIDGAVYDPVAKQVQACVNQKMTFCFDIGTTDPVGRLFVSDNTGIALSLAGMNVAYSAQKTKKVRGCVTWTPSASQAGFKNLILNVKDSTCHPPGIVFQQVFTIPIYVNPPVKAFKDTSVCPGDKIQLFATGGGLYQWQELGGGTSSLSCVNCTTPTVTPYATMTYIVQSNLTAFCKHNKDSVDITMLKMPEHDNMPDTITCPGTVLKYDLNIKKEPNVTYTVQWTPGTYLNSATSENPISNPLNDIEYRIVVSASNNRCKSFDTARITLLDGFKIETPDTAICEGASVNIRATGDPAYTYSWSSNATVNFSDPAVINPTVTPVQRGPIKFELRAKRAGCDDSVATLNLDVQPIPTVAVDADKKMCYGDTVTLNGIVTPEDYKKYNYQWSPGAALTQPNSSRPLFTAFQDVNLVLTVATPAGCKGQDSMKIDALPADFLFPSADTAVCPGKVAHIKMKGTDVDSFWWDENSPYMNNRYSWNPVIKPVATHTYTVYGVDKNGCKDTQRVTIVVHPAAVLGLPDSVVIHPGENYKINPSGNALHYSWFPPVGLSGANIADPVANPKVNTRYFVTARTEAGCEIKDSVNVFVADDSYLRLPNVFSPGRGNNSTFKLLHLGDAQLSKFIVYNRWGVKVFETTDITKGWDGTYNGTPQPMGVYMYTIEAQTPGGRTFKQNGNVTLIR
jgi:gliding motility-associated-like protein